MTLEAAIASRLLGHAPLTALVENRIFAGVAPEGTKTPYVAFFRIAGARHSGTILRVPKYQFSCFATSYSEARAVAREIIRLFDAFSGVVAGVVINQASVENELDLFEKDTGLHHVPVDIQFNYWEE